MMLFFTGIVQGSVNAQASQNDNDILYYSDIIDSLEVIYKNPLKFMTSEDPNEGFLEFYQTIKDMVLTTHLDSMVLFDVDSNQVLIEGSGKPLFFHITASWCAPCVAEKPALMDLVEKYHDKVQFVSIFWDGPKGVKKMREEYHDEMALIPSRIKGKGPNEAIVPGFKHILGFPTTFYVAADRKILEMTLGGSSVGSFPGKDGEMITYTEEDVYKIVLESFEKGISLIMKQM